MYENGNSFAEGYMIGKDADNSNSWCGNGGLWWIVILLIFGWGGFGNGFGGFGGGNGAMQNYVLGSDFATIQRQLSDGFSAVERKGDSISNGLCDGFYTQAQLVNGINQNVANMQYNLSTAITTGGYETRNAIAGIGTQIAQCCCENEKSAMQNRFDMAQYNCGTLQAIDKLGDRIIDYMAQEKAQTLRDENQALRLAASQTAQNAYLVNQLRPCPIPAYTVANPYCNCGYNGCNC